MDTHLAPTLAADDERTVFLDALEESLRPLMRAVFEYGVSYQDLVELVRALYTFGLRERFEAEGRPVSEARLGLQTGVNKGEVVKLITSRAHRDAERSLLAKYSDQLGQLLTRWHDDPQFSTPYGAPLELSLRPEGTFRTIDQLIAVSGIELDRETAIAYLRAAGCIEVHGDRFVRCVSRSLISRKADIARISELGRAGAAQNSTLIRNLFSRETDKTFFERKTISDFRISESGRDLMLFHLRSDGADFINELDRWISVREESLADPNGAQYGVSMYFFEVPKSTQVSKEALSLSAVG